MHNFILFPSLSSGQFKFCFINNDTVDDKSIQYYNDTEINYPYFLLSAGHNVSFNNLRKDMKLEGAFVMGDSGGFQLCNTIHPDAIDIKQTLQWLENNCDIFVNFDIPVHNKFNIGFNECLERSYNNFKYFNENRSKNKLVLNVLQGSNKEQQLKWYNKVKDFEFDGWAISIKNNEENLIPTLDIILNDKYCKYIHIFGISDLNIINKLIAIQKLNPNIQFSTDSSIMSILAQNHYLATYENGMIHTSINSDMRRIDLLYKNILACVDYVKFHNFS